MRALVLALLGGLPLAGCAEPCVSDLKLDCTPLYTDLSFSNVWTQTLQPRCAPGGASCHQAAGAQGGLVLEPEDVAYEALVSSNDGATPRAVAGDAACSLLVWRIEHQDIDEQMPPGAPLSEAERCVLRLWVEEGASR